MPTGRTDIGHPVHVAARRGGHPRDGVEQLGVGHHDERPAPCRHRRRCPRSGARPPPCCRVSGWIGDSRVSARTRSWWDGFAACGQSETDVDNCRRELAVRPWPSVGAATLTGGPGHGTAPARGDWRGPSLVQLRGVELNRVRTGSGLGTTIAAQPRRRARLSGATTSTASGTRVHLASSRGVSGARPIITSAVPRFAPDRARRAPRPSSTSTRRSSPGSSALAFSRPFRRQGLISRRAALRSGYAQLLLMLSGADADTMESAAAADHRAVHRLGGRPDPGHRRRDAARDRPAAGLRRGHRADRRAPGERRRGGRALRFRPGSGGADRRAGRCGLLPGHPHAGRERPLQRRVSSTTATARRRRQAARDIAAERGYRLADCRAYSDSITDLPLLEAVGHPTVVNPDRALRRLAAQRGWPVLTFVAPVALRSRFRPNRTTTVAAAGPAPAALFSAGWYGHRRPEPRALTARLNDPTATDHRLVGSRQRRRKSGPNWWHFRATDRHPPCLNRCTATEALMWLRSRTTKSTRTSNRPGAVRQRSTRPPRFGLRARRSGAPRTARRGRHVVVGLRTGTLDAEAATRHVVHAWISMFVLSRAAFLTGRRPSLCRPIPAGRSAPGVGDRDALPWPPPPTARSSAVASRPALGGTGREIRPRRAGTPRRGAGAPPPGPPAPSGRDRSPSR